MSGKFLGVAVILIILGVLFVILGMNTNWLFIVGALMLVAGGVMAYLHFQVFNKPKEKTYYCADCGQYLGTKPRRCDRCDSNRYTDTDPGPGITVKNKKI